MCRLTISNHWFFFFFCEGPCDRNGCTTLEEWAYPWGPSVPEWYEHQDVASGWDEHHPDDMSIRMWYEHLDVASGWASVYCEYFCLLRESRPLWRGQQKISKNISSVTKYLLHLLKASFTFYKKIFRLLLKISPTEIFSKRWMIYSLWQKTRVDHSIRSLVYKWHLSESLRRPLSVSYIYLLILETNTLLQYVRGIEQKC